MKTKTIRVNTDDALKIEQEARELSAELEKNISVGEVFHSLVVDMIVKKGKR